MSESVSVMGAPAAARPPAPAAAARRPQALAQPPPRRRRLPGPGRLEPPGWTAPEAGAGQHVGRPRISDENCPP